MIYKNISYKEMDKLEKDLLFLLATELSLHDLLRFCQTSKRINDLVCNRDNVWSYKLSKEYPNWKSFNFDKTKTLKEIYITLYQLQILKQKLNINYDLLNMYNLQNLKLTFNFLKEIPKEIGLLYNLQRFFLSYNKIKKIPKEIGQLHNLHILNLNHNKIKEIPKEIGQLHNLEQLYLRNNKIKKIPKEIGQLHNLRYIDLNNNQIKEIPREIKKIYNLQISLKNNKIKEIPDFINIK